MVYHHGKYATGGHYTLDVLRQDHSEWLKVDDTFIEPVNEADVVVGSVNSTTPGSQTFINPRTGIPDKVAYLLFYQKVI